MPRRYKDDAPISGCRLTEEFMRLKRGSVTRRHFLGVTGLGLAAATLAHMAGPPAFAAEDLGVVVSVATWPNYHDPATFEAFTEATGVAVEVSVFGSNEAFLDELRSGNAAWDLFVPTNYTISTFAALGLIDPIDLAKVPNFDPTTQSPRFSRQGTVDGTVYALPKNWGTTGIAVNAQRIRTRVTDWKSFFEIAMTEADGRAIVHDYQLTAIGNALVARGHSFNSVDPAELADAEELLLRVKPHLYALESDYQPSMRATEAWMTMCWVNDAAQLHRDMPEIVFSLGKDGGEIWSDFYAIPASAANKPAGYALMNFLMEPRNAVREHIANSAPATDSRVIALLPDEITGNPIIYPEEAALTPLEFGAAVTLTDPARAELMARFRAA